MNSFESAPVAPRQGYDGVPINDFGSDPRRRQYKWRVPIEHVSQEERDRRILESPMEYILEKCGEYQRPSPAEQRALFYAYRRGDMEAKRILMEHSVGLVVAVAKEFRATYDLSPQDMADLVQDGFIGLIRAIEKFDPDHVPDDGKPGEFSTYAWRGIKQGMQRSAVFSGRTIHIPIEKQWHQRKIARATGLIWRREQRAPTLDEILEETDLTQAQVHAIQTMVQQPTSLDKYVHSEETGEAEWEALHTAIPAEESQTSEEIAAAAELRKNIIKVMEDLPYRSRRILQLRFGFDEEPHGFDEIGRIFNVTRERIRQIQRDSLEEIEPSLKQVVDDDTEYPTSEEERGKEQVAAKRAKYRDFTDYTAWQARAASERLRVGYSIQR